MPDRVTRAMADGRAGAPIRRPSQLAAIMRPELPDLAREIIAQIRERIPEYARPMDGPYGQALRGGVQEALTSFFDTLADPLVPHERRDQVCRQLGEFEALEGRSLDSLQTAYRIGVHVAWRRVMDVGLRCAAPSSVMSLLADAMLAYMDELASLSLQGYREAKARSEQSRAQWRRRLLHLVLERPAAPRRAIAELAELAGWPLPAEATMVAVEPGHGPAPEPPELPAGALADFGARQPHLLLPGPVERCRRQALERALAGRRAAVGISVPLAEAADSLRWARRLLSLSRSGVTGNGPVSYCEDHLTALWLLADEPLADQFSRRLFGKLDTLTPAQRQRLVETLGAWLETRGGAAEMARLLEVHPQTVRYRMRKLEQALGDELADPATRFAMEMVLRASRLRRQASAPGPAQAPADAPDLPWRPASPLASRPDG